MPNVSLQKQISLATPSGGNVVQFSERLELKPLGTFIMLHGLEYSLQHSEECLSPIWRTSFQHLSANGTIFISGEALALLPSLWLYVDALSLALPPLHLLKTYLCSKILLFRLGI